MAQPAIEFWYSVGSTYTYLSVMRATELCRAEGVSLTWKPFNVRDIMMEVGNRPFTGKPVKMSYMWRDIQRRAGMYDMPVKVPAPYPLSELDLANRVAILGLEEGWQVEYTKETYRKWFQEGVEPGLEPALSETLTQIGLDPAAVLERANGEPVIAALEKATEQARSLGIFGSPSFVVGQEVFWGDDRLEDAISWSQRGRVVRA